MKVLIITAAFFCFSMGVFAEAQEEIIQIDMDRTVISGSQWQTLSSGEKWVYLFGYEDGARNTALHFIASKDKKENIYQGLPMQIKGAGSISDLIAEVDDFYSDERNIDIPITSVLLVIKNRKMGVEEKKIQRYIRSVRKNPQKNKDF